MSATLVLNATFEPLNTVSWERAITLVLGRRAEIVTPSDREYRAADVTVPVPLVIRLLDYVRVPRRAALALSRRAVLARDGHVCAYCGAPARTVDHIQPRSRGGANSFENLVAACGPCNHRKADRTPGEAGMVLRVRPYTPAGFEALALALGRVDDAWVPWLGTGRAR